MLRSLATDLLYHGKIITTETRAKEVRRVAERLITLAIKERDNYTEETVTAKVPRKDKDGKRVKQDENGKRVTVFNTVDKTIRKDNPSRLNARRKILSVLYPVTEISGSRPKMRSARKPVDMAAKMFDDIAPRYASRQGGYTRMVKIGPRRGDAAEQVIIELV
ncbi:MAG: bL17 family ribosomal protein [Clostridiales bacterium]|nr:bL17 family ribosomal protein [Clostridiales bacterium]